MPSDCCRDEGVVGSADNRTDRIGPALGILPFTSRGKTVLLNDLPGGGAFFYRPRQSA